MVTLHDGSQVDSWSEEWRLECLARYVWAMRPLERRREWMEEFGRRNPSLVGTLRQRMLAIQQKGKA